MIPLIDIALDKRQETEIKRKVIKVIDSKNYILGESVKKFEQEFAKFIGVKYAIGVGNGTDALRLSLRALGIGNGNKVLTVALTSPFTAIAIIEEGAVPIFCDVDEKTWTIDLADVEKKVDKNTKAIIPVHLFGNPCDMDAILKIAKDYNLRVIEDACQAHGAKFRGKMIGSFGDAGTFSFYPTKNLGAFGDAGIITTNDLKVAEMIKILRHGGQTKRFWHEYQGINSRLDEIQAAVLSVRLKYLEKENEKREKLAKKYKSASSDLPIKFQETLHGARSANHLFVFRTERRDKLQKFLTKNGVTTDVYYPYPVHLQPAFREYVQSHLKNTELLTKELLALPLCLNLKLKDQKIIIEKIKLFFSKKY